MYSFRLLGVFAIIPATILLTISFFILFALRKLESEGLKVFGYAIAALLWISAALVFSAGIYTVSTGKSIACPVMQQMMEKQMHGQMMGGKIQGSMMRGDTQTQMMKH